MEMNNSKKDNEITGIDVLDEMNMNSAVDNFKKNPRINVISKEVFESRVEKVFNQLWLVLSKSFGPYGAPTIINCYPYKHVTKDGYTIMKNLSFDASETLLDQSIRDMVDDVCGRLNFSVGDGTTSAVISTNAIYQNYRKKKNEFDEKFVMPRDVVNLFNEIKDKVILELGKIVRPIQSDDMDILANNIRDVVYISSNGDKVITDYISDLYRTLGCPAISCELAVDGITKYSTIKGYQIDMALMDKLYINSDDDTLKLEDADIIIFSSKITKNTYEKILKPLRDASAARGRHLIVAAPFYDETALRQTIRRDLNNEYQKTHDVSMILMVYKALSAHTRKLVEDFSVLANTLVIDKDLERSIYEQLDAGSPIDSIFNLDHREIPGLKIVGFTKDTNIPCLYQRTDDVNDPVLANLNLVELSESHIDLGYVKDISLGLKRSLFKEFFYDKKKYEIILKDAVTELRQTEDKYKKLGTFNLEVSLAQQRLYSLKLKMGLIEVGADSELSQCMLKDQVDDAIKAAASAFNYGVIKGCNVSLQRIIEKIKTDYMNSEQEESKIYITLLDILLDGFADVYKTILCNAFDDVELCQGTTSILTTKEYYIALKNFCNTKLQRFGGFDMIFNRDDGLIIREAINRAQKRFGKVTVHGVIVEYSILTDQVFDVSEWKFSDKIINSFQTDEEILKATIDLISILIVGNQMVITQRQNFE